MAGLIVAGYDAVHKQGQVKHPSLDYNFSPGQDEICSSLSQYLRVFCGTNKSSTNHPPPRCGVCLLAACACVSRWLLVALDPHTSMAWWTTHTGWVILSLSSSCSFIWFFQDNMPQKECEDLVLQAVTQVDPTYILRPQTIEFPYAEISWLILH